MESSVFVIVSIVLLCINMLQAVDRYFANEQARAREKELITAFLSKNATDFSVAVKTEEKGEDLLRKDPDEVFLDQASEETFDKFIKNQTQ